MNISNTVRNSVVRILLLCMMASAITVLSFGMGSDRASADNFDIYHWDVLPHPGSNAPNPTSSATGGYYIGDYNHSARRFKWTVDTAHSSRVSYNLCADWGYFEATDVGAHETTARYFGHTSSWNWDYGDCVVVRGYTNFSSPMYNRNAQAWL